MFADLERLETSVVENHIFVIKRVRAQSYILSVKWLSGCSEILPKNRSKSPHLMAASNCYSCSNHSNLEIKAECLSKNLL